MLDYIPSFELTLVVVSGRWGTSSLAVRPSELVENNLSLSDFKHGLP